MNVSLHQPASARMTELSITGSITITLVDKNNNDVTVFLHDNDDDSRAFARQLTEVGIKAMTALKKETE